MITVQDIQRGLLSKTIQLTTDPNMQFGTVCQIGGLWFYFGGQTAEDCCPEEYLRDIPMDDIVREIFETLEDFKRDEILVEEYEYYEMLLTNQEGQG